MRMFVAVVPPDDALADLEAFLEPRREHGPFRWTSPDQLHVTLAFLASVREHALDELVDGLERAVARRGPVDVRITGGGAFPDPSRAKVLYAGLGLTDEASAELGRLARGATTAAGRAGVAVDGRRFRPHLTLARLGRPAEVSRWVRLLDAYDGPAWRVDRIRLVESHLGEGPRRRPRHEVVAELMLPGRASRRAPEPLG